MSPEQFRNALKLRTFDSSPSRAVNTYGAVQAAATESPSRPSLKGSQTVSLTARMQAVSPNHLFDTSTARMGAWIDERSAQSDRAVVSSTGTLAAERSRRSSGTTQTQTQYTSAAGVRNTSQSQPRVLCGAPAEEQEQFDLHLRDTVTQGLGLSLNAGSVGVPSAKGTWTHRAPEMKRSPSASLYFRSQVANFGMTAVGTNARQKLELCNSSGEEVGSVE